MQLQHRLLFLVWLPASLLLAPAAVRADGQPKPKRPRVAVLDVKASGAVDQRLADGLNPVIGGKVAAQPDLQVITTADIRTALGFERQKQMLSCSDTNCLAEIAGALGADFLLSTELSKVGSTWIVGLSLLDARNAQVKAKATRSADAEEFVVRAAVLATREILQKIPGRTTESVEALTAEAKADTGMGSAVPGATLLATGAAALVAGAGLYGYAWSVQGQYDKSQASHGQGGVTLAQAHAASTEAMVGLAAGGVGIAAAAVGTVLLLTRDRQSAHIALAPSPHGVFASFSMSLP